MLEADAIRLQHMREAAQKAIHFLGSKSRADLNNNELLVLGIIKCIEIVGEAANKVTDECRISNSFIPWADIVAMRHRLIHGYFDINLDIVYKTVKDELPGLAAEISKALKS